MKLLPVTIAGIMMALSHNSAGAITGMYCVKQIGNGPELNTVTNCSGKNSSVYYFNNYGIRTCDICDTGFLRIKQTISVPGCSNDAEYYTCECNCTNCTSGQFANANTGYQSRAVKTCNCASGSPVCQTSYEYRCAAGYYGTSTNGTTGCTQCPSDDGAAATSEAGAAYKYKCYIPSGQSFSNTSGSGTFTGNSYWCLEEAPGSGLEPGIPIVP